MTAADDRAPEGDADREARFLVLAPTANDGRITTALLRRSGLAGVCCADIDALCREAREGAAALLIADEALTPRAMACLAELVGSQPSWSDLPIIVFTGRGATVQRRTPTRDLLAPLGNVTLLERPLKPSTLLSVARAAERARARQYEARAALAREQEAVRERDLFLAMLGHELRNPLGVIVLAAEMLGRGDVAHVQQLIRRQARHLTRLVDDLLDVARVTRGKIALRRKVVDLGELIDRCVETNGRMMRAREQEVSTRSVSQARVWGDPVRLEQIFSNLLTNASKYTRPGGHVTVAVGVTDRHAVVRVQDDGVGISAEMLPRVFDLFAQVEGTLDRSEGGLGIGLTLVRRLVELHDGHITAHSDGPGQGSCFTVTLPLASEAAALEAQEAAPAIAATARRVLLVEDNAHTRELLKALVETWGHEVHTAADGPDGVRQAAALRPDALVVDIGLPGLDGYEVARRVREALGAEVLLIALTGYGQPDDQRRAIEAGFDVHCTKPVDPEHLRRLLGGDVALVTVRGPAPAPTG